MTVDISTLTIEVQTRCNALTNSSTAKEVIEQGIAAKKIEQAGGMISRTVLDAQLQRISNLSDGTTTIATLISLAASVEVVDSGGGSIPIKKTQLFKTSGTWPLPANLVPGSITLTGIAGGSSGRNYSSGGGGLNSYGGTAGEWVYEIPVEDPLADVAVTIGVGGAASSIDNSGNAGSATSFGTACILAGGPVGFITTGGALGGGPITSSSFIPAQDCPCAIGGSGGPANGGNRPGGGGLILDHLAPAVSGVGYGAGGYSAQNGGTSGAGANGALRVTWWEYTV